MNHEVYRRGKQVRLVLAAVNRRVLEMLRIAHL